MNDLPSHPKWIQKLPKVRGRYSYLYNLAKVTWFQVGGPADVLFKPKDTEDLIHFLKNIPQTIPILPLGVGSNILIRDGGIEGVVIRLGRDFSTIKIDDKDPLILHVGAGALDRNVALFSAENNIGSLSFLSGIPGTIGGALRMNAGAYGSEIKDILVQATAIDLDGNKHTLHPQDMNFSYRHCGIPQGWVFTQATLKGKYQKKNTILKEIKEIQHKREDSQPIRERTSGSTFANPPNEKAWQLIDKAGCRGLKIGNAQISTHHCNFLINTGLATAANLEDLGNLVQKKVYIDSGITLKWEIQRVGRLKK